MYSAILSKDLQFGLVDQCLHQHLNFLRYAFFFYLFLGYDLLLPCLKIKIITSFTFRFRLYCYLFVKNLRLCLAPKKAPVNGLHDNALDVVFLHFFAYHLLFGLMLNALPH